MTPSGRLKKAIAESGRTQAEVARLIGTTDAYLSNLLSGARQPSAELALRLCGLVGLDSHAALELHLGRSVSQSRAA